MNNIASRKLSLFLFLCWRKPQSSDSLLSHIISCQWQNLIISAFLSVTFCVSPFPLFLHSLFPPLFRRLCYSFTQSRLIRFLKNEKNGNGNKLQSTIWPLNAAPKSANNKKKIRSIQNAIQCKQCANNSHIFQDLFMHSIAMAQWSTIEIVTKRFFTHSLSLSLSFFSHASSK